MAIAPADLLDRPAAEGARLVALAYLDDAARALERLPDAADREALHDFRVALRRLSSTLRAYREVLRGSVRRRHRRRLREIGESTNRGRDAEVAVSWLRPLARNFTAHQRLGLRWLVERIAGEQGEALDRDSAKLSRSFARVERPLRKRLSAYRQEVMTEGLEPLAPFRDIFRAALADQARRLDAALADIRRANQQAAVHRARIAAKRLRYQLEPLAAGVPGGVDLAARLKSLQDLLGELCDVRVLEQLLHQAVEAAGAARAREHFDGQLARRGRRGVGPQHTGRRPSYRAGLLAVARRLRSRRTSGFSRLRAGWLGGGFAQAVETANRDVDRFATSIPVLRRVPPRMARRQRSAP